MKRLIAVSLICALIGRAEGRTIRRLHVARIKADRYESATNAVITTKGCTYNAKWGAVVVDENGPQSVIYFLDKNDEVETECHVKSVRWDR